MRVYGSTEPPQAFVRFCEEFPEECVSTSGIAARPPATAQRFRELDETNRRINRAIRPKRTSSTTASLIIGRFPPTAEATVKTMLS
jgi:predicted transglutaminase-like cysteine proteinase